MLVLVKHTNIHNSLTAGRKSSFHLSEMCCRECLWHVFHLKQQEGYAWLSAAGWQPVSASGRPVWLHIYRDPPPPPPLPLCQEKANLTSVLQIVLRVKKRLDSHQPCYIFQLNCYLVANRNGIKRKKSLNHSVILIYHCPFATTIRKLQQRLNSITLPDNCPTNATVS